MIEDHS